MAFRLYVAGTCARMAEIMEHLQDDRRFTVVCGWNGREHDDNTPETLTKHCLDDLAKLEKADAMLAVMEDEHLAYRGTFTEIGFAIARSIPIAVVCAGQADRVSSMQYSYSHHCQTNGYYHHPSVLHFNTVENAIAALLLE